MILSEAIKTLEGMTEGIDWAAKVRSNPTAYGTQARTIPLLVDMISRYKAGQFRSQLAVYETMIAGQKRFFATDQASLKRALGAVDDFTLVGHIIPQRRVGQKPTWMPKR